MEIVDRSVPAAAVRVCDGGAGSPTSGTDESSFTMIVAIDWSSPPFNRTAHTPGVSKV